MIALSLVAIATQDIVSGWSIACGGMISIIPSWYFANEVLRFKGARSIEKVVHSAYKSELIKLILMGSGFAIVFALVEPLKPALVFAGFFVTHLGGLIVTSLGAKTQIDPPKNDS
jgi:F0F1-type ATP synthase assembly protein I